MKKLLLILLFLSALNTQGQTRQVPIVLDLSGGDTTIVIDNITSFIYPSWQITATGLDSATATFTLEKSNDLVNYGPIPSASGTFAAGNSVRFIEFANPFNNSAFKLIIVVNTVTVGTLKIDVNLIKNK